MIEHRSSWPRNTPDKPGERERAIAKALAEGGATVIETSEPRVRHRHASERFTELPEPVRRAVIEFDDRANMYLAGAVIVDHFDDHVEREQWRDTIRESYGEEIKAYLRNNRMRNNVITPLGVPLSNLLNNMRALPADNAVRLMLEGHVTAALVYFRQQFMGHRRYATSPDSEKVQIIEEFSGLLEGYLDASERV